MIKNWVSNATIFISSLYITRIIMSIKSSLSNKLSTIGLPPPNSSVYWGFSGLKTCSGAYSGFSDSTMWRTISKTKFDRCLLCSKLACDSLLKRIKLHNVPNWELNCWGSLILYCKETTRFLNAVTSSLILSFSGSYDRLIWLIVWIISWAKLFFFSLSNSS